MPILAGQKVQVILLTGRKTKSQFPNNEYFKAVPFINGLADVIRAADLVVSRAGASSFAELAAANRPAILIPHPHLTGNHQTKNAAVYAKNGAAIVLSETEATPEKLSNLVLDLLQNETRRQALSQAISQFARPHALSDMVDLIINAGADHVQTED
jgi:UDP-N-acetylglucosamine--N-acetylmuramyl-(pentapeptide) pyrophosphoryl-undecaprenol N-acetylglucosamine transferase